MTSVTLSYADSTTFFAALLELQPDERSAPARRRTTRVLLALSAANTNDVRPHR